MSDEYICTGSVGMSHNYPACGWTGSKADLVVKLPDHRCPKCDGDVRKKPTPKPCPLCVDTTGELSRVNGLLDAAHVYLDSIGVTRCENEALHDRMARYVGTVETQLEEAKTNLSAEIHLRQAAEARATAAEQERDRAYVECNEKIREVLAMVSIDADRPSPKRDAVLDGLWRLRAEKAEQREAEKDKRISELKALLDLASLALSLDDEPDPQTFTTASDPAALASPSTPSPAHEWVKNDPRWPSIRDVEFCATCGTGRRADGKNKPCMGSAPAITLRAYAETPSPAPSPTQEPT